MGSVNRLSGEARRRTLHQQLIYAPVELGDLPSERCARSPRRSCRRWSGCSAEHRSVAGVVTVPSDSRFHRLTCSHGHSSFVERGCAPDPGRQPAGGAARRRPGVHGRAAAHRPAHRRPRAARGRAGPREDAHRAHARRDDRHDVLSASSSRPTCCRPTSSARRSTISRPGSSSVKKGPIFAQHHSRRRDQPRAGQGAGRAARGDAGEAGHDRRHDVSSSRSRSSCSRRRTRSSRRARIRCPRRRSIASCSSCASAIRRATRRRRSCAAWRAAQPIAVEHVATPRADPRGARSASPSCTWTTASWTTSSTSCTRRASRRRAGCRTSRR